MKKLWFWPHAAVRATLALLLLLTGSLALSQPEDPFRVAVALHSDIEGGNPMQMIGGTTQVVFSRNVFEGLVHFAADLSIEPVLAESWRIVDDHTWEFALREGVSFSNGAPFTARDVQVTFEHLLDPDNDWQRRIQLVDVIDEVRIVDDHTVQLVTKEPDPLLLTRLVRYYFVMPADYLESHSNAEIAAAPIGTGPFTFDRWDRAERVILERNENYWGEQPDVDIVEWRIIPDANARLSALRAGEIDILPEISVDVLDEVEADPDLYVSREPSMRVIYVGLDAINEGPLQDQRVRQALNHVVNVDEIVEVIMGGLATRIYSIITPFNDHWDPENVPIYGHDPDRARELLAEAGYEPEDMSLVLNSPRDRYIKDSEVAQAVAIQLQQFGIDVELRFHEWGTYLDMIENRNASDMWLLGGTDTTMDAVDQMYYRGAKDMPWVNWYDPEFEADLLDVLPIVDPELRAERALELQQRYVEAAPYIFMYQQYMFAGVSERVAFTARADEAINVHLIERAE